MYVKLFTDAVHIHSVYLKIYCFCDLFIIKRQLISTAPGIYF